MRTRAWSKAGFVVANVAVMVILHGNSRQPWPRIPYLSLQDESEREHARLVFNTLAVVTLGQIVIGRLPGSRLRGRAVSLIASPGVLLVLLALNRRVLRLHGAAERVFHLLIVVGLPLGAAFVEDALAREGT
jgi:hypothetical protein